ncbi:MAG: LemA family protein, partial [Gammaproteobacteria bacterium]
QRLIALAEAYPDLKANQNFLKLQIQLTEVEDHLQYARRFYNGAVQLLNSQIESFPDVLIARSCGFKNSEFFDADQTAATVPQVDLSSP